MNRRARRLQTGDILVGTSKPTMARPPEAREQERRADVEFFDDRVVATEEHDLIAALVKL